MSRKKLRRAEWRVPNCTPHELSVRYQAYLERLVNLATGRTFGWDTASKNFYRTLSKCLGIRNWRYKVDEIRDVLMELRSVDREDIYQEAHLLLLDHYHKYIAKRQKVKFTLYILMHVPRRLAEKVAELVRVEQGDKHIQMFSEEYWMDEPENLKLDLGWVTIRKTDGIFSLLTTFQKYLLFLRYNRNMTIPQISSFLGRHEKLVEADFSKIIQLVDGGNNASVRG